MIVRRRRPHVGARRPRMIVRRSPMSGVPGEMDGPFTGVPWRRIAAGLSALVIAGLVAIMAFSVWRSSYFDIESFQVSGTNRVPPETLVHLSRLEGERIFTADLGGAERRIAQHPLIRDVSVTRDWPGGVSIAIEERLSWGVWEQAGVLYTIDREGYVMGSFPADSTLPAIRSSSEQTLAQGDRVDFQAVEAAALIYQLLPQTLGVEVSEVAYIDGEGVRVTTADGQVALLGDSSSIPYKLEAWGAVAEEAAVRNLDYAVVDLRYGNRPVLREEASP